MDESISSAVNEHETVEHRFLALAAEIVERIEQSAGEWWTEVSELTIQLEKSRRQLSAPFNRDRKWDHPAFLILNLYRGMKLTGLAAEFEDKRQWGRPEWDGFSLLLCSDPLTENCDHWRLWNNSNGKFHNTFQETDTRHALNYLHKWVRAVERNQAPQPWTENDKVSVTAQAITEPKSGDGETSDDKPAELRQLSEALDEHQSAQHKITAARRRIEFRKFLPCDAKEPDWVRNAIDWIAENGRKPKWAELARALPVGARAIQASRWFGSHPDYENAVNAAVKITSD